MAGESKQSVNPNKTENYYFLLEKFDTYITDVVID
jgi:hypothetical protein